MVDRSLDMLAVARTKGLPVIRGRRQRPPPPDRRARRGDVGVDAAPRPRLARRALAEGRRVVGPGGRLALMAFTREQLAVHWILDYFPTTAAWFGVRHRTRGRPPRRPARRHRRARRLHRRRRRLDGRAVPSPRAAARSPNSDARRRSSSGPPSSTAPSRARRPRPSRRATSPPAAGPTRRCAELRDRIGDAMVLGWTKPTYHNRSGLESAGTPGHRVRNPAHFGLSDGLHSLSGRRGRATASPSCPCGPRTPRAASRPRRGPTRVRRR